MIAISPIVMDLLNMVKVNFACITIHNQIHTHFDSGQTSDCHIANSHGSVEYGEGKLCVYYYTQSDTHSLRQWTNE